jgi:hypothetical protein
MPITFYAETGLSLYVRFNNDVAVDLTEGSSLKVGQYAVTDAAIYTAGLTTGGTYAARVFIGTAAGQANTDQEVGVVPTFSWYSNGVTNEERTFAIEMDYLAAEHNTTQGLFDAYAFTHWAPTLDKTEGIEAAVDTLEASMALVKAKTDNLPASPASTGDITTALNTYDAPTKAEMDAAIATVQTPKNITITVDD